MRELILYKTWSGRCPVEEFLDGLPGKQRQKIVWVLQLVLTLDSVPSRYLSKLVDTDGLWEVRTTFGGEAFRLLGFFDEGRLVVLVSAFLKTTERTPAGEIALAEERRRDYYRRKGGR